MQTDEITYTINSKLLFVATHIKQQFRNYIFKMLQFSILDRSTSSIGNILPSPVDVAQILLLFLKMCVYAIWLVLKNQHDEAEEELVKLKQSV